MKFGLSEEVYEKILNVVKKYDKYTFKIFGSRAKNTYKETSDIDIAVFGNITYQEKYKIIDDFDLLDIVYKIDIVFINENTNKNFKEEVEKEGIEII